MDSSSPTPIVLKKGGPLCDGLSNASCSQQTVCPKEKFVGCVNEDGCIFLQLISDDSQSFVIKDAKFIGYEWVVPLRAQQDCVLDHYREGNSELLAVTSDMECRWYTLSERQPLPDAGGGEVVEREGMDEPSPKVVERDKDEGQQGSSSFSFKVDLMATLKNADLSNKLRKMDFPDHLNSVDMLGSEDGQALVLFNSCLVCRFSLDADFGSVALVGCFVLQLSLHRYNDDQLPSTLTPLSWCTFATPLLFSMTTDGIVFVHRASNGASIGVLNVLQYCHYHCGQSCDLLLDVVSSTFKMLYISHDLNIMAVPTPSNHVLLINIPDYFQTFPYHYHHDFLARTTKQFGSSSPSLSTSRVDFSKEEEQERLKYGGLLRQDHTVKFKGSFAGSYSWMCRLENLDARAQQFEMDRGSVSMHQTSELPQKLLRDSSSDGLEALPMKRMWYETPHQFIGAKVREPVGFPVVTGIQTNSTTNGSVSLDALRPSARYYQSHCILPASCSGGAQVVYVDFTSGMVVVHYGHAQHVQREATKFLLGFTVTEMTLYHTDTHSYYSARLPESSIKLNAVSPDALVYFVNEHSFFIVTYNLSQEQFVGKMLMFGSADVAEEVCHLNRWDKCSLPINALETALELRQLDTLAFFLRSRDTDQDQDSDMPALPPLSPDQLDTVVQLLIDAIQHNCHEEHHYQFAGQLLIMTLEFVIRMIKTEAVRESSESRHTSPSESVEDGGSNSTRPFVSLSDLTSYVQQLRNFLPKATVMLRRDQHGLEEGEGSGLWDDDLEEDYITEFLSPAQVADWNKLSSKEVIRDALLRNCLPLAQSYLMQRKPEDSLQPRMGSRSYGYERGVSIAEAMDSLQQGGQKHLSTSHMYRFDASLRSMRVTGVGYVLEALQRRNIKLAKSILSHMGMDVQSSLKQVCFHTLDRELRDYMCTVLDLTGSETAALDYVHILERYYPLQSYDQAVELHSNKSTASKMAFQSTALPVLPGIMSRTTAIPSVGNLQDLYPENFGGDHNLVWDPNVLSPSSQTSALYVQVPLAVVLTWDTATKQRLFFEHFVLQKQADGSDCERLVKKQHIFDYYISHNNQASALQFLLSIVPSLEDPTPSPAYLFPLLAALPCATKHVQNVILDELARNGILTFSELKNFPVLMHRLGRIHSLFTLPHPLIKTTDYKSQLTEKNCPSSSPGELFTLEMFHKVFLNYCIEQKFFSLMTHYLDLYNLGLSDSSVSMLEKDLTNHPWVSVLLNYRRAAQNPSNPDSIFQASLSCGKMLLSMDPNPPADTVMGMLQSGHILMALSTLMFAPVSLEQAMNESNRDEPWYADSEVLKQATSAYTSLQAAIFPPAPTSLTPAQSQDITVYELLQDSVPFDISRLFKWQTTNTVSSRHEDKTSCMAELPHFSSPALAEKFAVSEHLDYVYYLRRGQPSFAFANFVATKLVGRLNPAKRISRLVSHVHWLAMHDLMNSRLAASCAALLEMLGVDSTTLRVDLQSACRIVKHEAYHNIDGVSKSLDIESDYDHLVKQFCQLHKSPDPALATSLLVLLESATVIMTKSNGVEECGLEAEDCWQLVQSFCTCHKLLPSVGFVTCCAQQGQWLPLLCHAQLYNIPSLAILKIVGKNLTNSSIKEHLTLAISSIDPSTRLLSPSLKDTDSSENLKSRRRKPSTGLRSSQAEKARKLVTTQTNLRAKFYSRVGLQRGTTPQPEPKDEGENVDREDVPLSLPSAAIPAEEIAVPVFPKTFPAALVEDELPGDLFSAIFKCDCHQISWKALLAHAIALRRPLLAILAACYEDAVAIECACAWMFATLKPSLFEKLTALLTVNGEVSVPDDKLPYCAEIQWRDWSTLDLSLMLISAMQHTPSPSAHFSLVFKYFDENSPLLSFLRFHEEFALRNNFDECKKHLQEFRLNIDKCREYGYSGVIGDLCWVEQVASSMASHMLVTCPTSFERSNLLKLLAEAHFGEDFKCGVLNFSDLHQMTQALNEAGLDSGVAFTVKEQFSTVPGLQFLNEIYSVRVRVDTDYVLGLLLEKGQFVIAKKYAIIVKSTASQITIKEAEYNLKQLRKSSYWTYLKARLNFWHQCNTNFIAAKVDPDSAVEFFQFIIDSSDQGSPVTPTEKALLLALVLKWMTESDGFKMEQTKEYEKRIWLSHVHSALEQEGQEKLSQSKFSGSPLSSLLEADTPTSTFSLLGHTSLLTYLSVSAKPEFKGRRQLTEFMLPDNVTVSLDRTKKSRLSEKEAEVFEVMLGRLMNAGLLSQARELATLFDYNSADLVIVLCCIQLSQMTLTPAELTEDVLSLISTHQPRHFTDPCTLHLEDPTHSWETTEYVRMMNILSDRVLHARQCCDCVITCFRIALALNVSYASIINTDVFETISELLCSQATDKYVLASKFISTCNLTAKEVANYLSNCISSSLHIHHAQPPADTKSAMFPSKMSSGQFQEVIQLVSDPVLLGNTLLHMAKTKATKNSDTFEDLSIQVELLIRAHDCYTKGCSVDGISKVLVVAKSWVQKIVQEKHFQLLVQLLIGISRYHEMSYIIGLLIEHDQFENLCHAGVEKEEQLRVALMEYLHKYCNDTDKLMMVTINFKMLREQAKATEDHAKKALAGIKRSHLVSNNTETVQRLKYLFDDFKVAAAMYNKENCLYHSEHCLSQARLVALQLSSLADSKQVVNLDGKAVAKFMEEQPFTESLIVSDAYVWSDWINPLYKKVIVGGDFRYLREYERAFTLTPTVYTEIASKFQHDRERTQNTIDNMKNFLASIKNLILKQKLVTQLGLPDVFPTTKYDTGYMNDLHRL